MASADVSQVAVNSSRLNVADRLATFAVSMPDAIAVAAADRNSKSYSTITFRELDADATRIARGLVAWGVMPGTRLVLLVRPGVEFVTLVFALLRAGVVIVLVDPGMGRKNLVECLAEAEPEGFVAIPVGQAARLWYRKHFPRARWNVTVGRRWFWGGMTLEKLRRLGDGTRSVPATMADDPAAIIFTSGSTGPPKGVLYTHRMFDTQVAEIQSQYAIAPGGVDLSCFALFALFNSAMGVTTVLPDMDFSRPAAARPYKLLRAADDWNVTQAFASPAVWRNVSAHCATTGDRIDSLRLVFSCGAPVSADVLRSTLAIAAPNAQMHTPYGATECLPVATIEAGEVLGKTAARASEGAGVCVGHKFDSIEWRIIRITDEPITQIDEAEEMPLGEIGELIVQGRQASPRYVTRAEANATSKISDTTGDWHRMGDVGYLDEAERFWYCGRKSHRVETAEGTLFTECVEGVFNAHPRVHRAALVGPRVHGELMPTVWLEVVPEHRTTAEYEQVLHDLKHDSAFAETERKIAAFLRIDSMPVDIRHNSKINREKLAVEAENYLNAASFVD